MKTKEKRLQPSPRLTTTLTTLTATLTALTTTLTTLLTTLTTLLTTTLVAVLTALTTLTTTLATTTLTALLKTTLTAVLTATVLLAAASCVKYDAEPFTGKIMPRVTGYSTGVTNDWIYFNLRTGEVFNETAPGQQIKEGEQYDRLDWDLAFCGYHMRTNSGTSGSGQGGAIDLGYGAYDQWTNSAQLPSPAEWVTDTDTDIYVTYSQADWYHYLVENNLDFDDNPWFDPNSGPARKLTSANRKLEEAMSLAGPPMSYTPSYHTYAIRTADGQRYFKLQVVSWYNVHTKIDDTGGELSYYCDELY